MRIHLPQVNKEFEVGNQKDLRTLLRQLMPGFLYHKPMDLIHCRGMGTCGTCAVKVEGQCSAPTAIEKWRLNFPPHKQSLSKGLRLACQCRPLGDLKVTKLSGKWGQGD
jgi:ferredoxin